MKVITNNWLAGDRIECADISFKLQLKFNLNLVSQYRVDKCSPLCSVEHRTPIGLLSYRSLESEPFSRLAKRLELLTSFNYLRNLYRSLIYLSHPTILIHCNKNNNDSPYDSPYKSTVHTVFNKHTAFMWCIKMICHLKLIIMTFHVPFDEIFLR